MSRYRERLRALERRNAPIDVTELTAAELEVLAAGASPAACAWIDGLTDEDLQRVIDGELSMPIEVQP